MGNLFNFLLFDAPVPKTSDEYYAISYKALLRDRTPIVSQGSLTIQSWAYILQYEYVIDCDHAQLIFLLYFLSMFVLVGDQNDLRLEDLEDFESLHCDSVMVDFCSFENFVLDE